ncbi:MAG: LuxR C-terminal-related transcriptional regulator [Thermosynechococcaceae cyanobacterium MS004]|nr:LuxR C-terminal-related transcriptional regulator [Thermosynechococcaceae cyanobacterium MS004]
MSNTSPQLIDGSQLIFYLQRINRLAQKLSGCFEPEEIANCITNGLIENFDCVFARIWLVEADAKFLRLVASSGLSTRTNGEFARVAMGSYKVGKIAQNRISFLSNNLVEEPWVKDRDWAIANKIQGFAGYPLTVGDRVVGVLAAFSQRPMVAEFLEVLQSLCTTIAVALEMAFKYQQAQQNWQSSTATPVFHKLVLSDQLACLLDSVRITLIGTEQVLPLSVHNIMLQLADVLKPMDCISFRLMYREDTVALEALISPSGRSQSDLQDALSGSFRQLKPTVTCLGGTLAYQTDIHQKVIQILLTVPYQVTSSQQNSPLSEREQEILRLLAQGLRDRDIATHLIISESTVKFHINNAVKKLKAQTRFQALYKVMVNGWIE